MAVPERLDLHFAIRAPLIRADLPGLCARICRLLESAQPRIAYCDLSAFAHADAVTVDALARLQLAARSYGCQIRLCHASPELRGLVALMGLEDVLPF